MSCLSVLAGNQLVMWDVTYKSLFKTTVNPTSHSHFTWINNDFWSLSQLSKRYKNYLLTIKPTTNREIKFDTGRWDFYELNFKSCLVSCLALHEHFFLLSYRVSFGLSLHRDRHPLIMLWLCELRGPPTVYLNSCPNFISRTWLSSRVWQVTSSPLLSAVHYPPPSLAEWQTDTAQWPWLCGRDAEAEYFKRRWEQGT